jgi:catechol 2,3-dioxygenase-like lactoylglutathione lyase family enzyme
VKNNSADPIRHRAVLVPELLCSDINESRSFYVDALGFEVLYDRPAENFLYLSLSGAEIMLEQLPVTPDHDGFWLTGRLEVPYGRGINFQIEVENVYELYDRLAPSQWPIFRSIEEKWYRINATEAGNRQFLIQDPDGYLLRLFEDLGTRSVVG